MPDHDQEKDKAQVIFHQVGGSGKFKCVRIANVRNNEPRTTQEGC